VYVAEPGLLDARATLPSSNGQCHGLALALALHARTGFPVVAVSSPRERAHMSARDPGRLTDIRSTTRRRSSGRECLAREVDAVFVGA
jgi:hypothetical protein